MNNENENPDASAMGNIDQPTQEPVTKHQFGVAALFWIPFIVGLGVAYLQRFDSPDILICGFLSVLIGVVVGLVVGYFTKKTSDAVFWGSLISAFGYISVASDPIYGDQGHRLVWATLGAVAGSIGATILTGRYFVNAVVCSLAAAAVMGTYYLFASHRSADLQFDLFGAPFIGFAIAIFIRLLMWLESRNRMPRYMTATWLLVVVIIGNMIGR